MKVLVTGGLGFIGSHICLELLSNNFEVLVVDSLINSNSLVIDNINKIVSQNKLNVRKMRIYEADLRDECKLIDIFREHSIKESSIGAVIHCAGLKSVNDSVGSPIDYWANNVGGTIKLIKVMEEFGCNTIIFSSSATIYGVGDGGLINENATINPINPYGQTKAAVERFLKDVFYSGNQKWKIVNLRYFNPTGAHKSGLIGESPKGLANNIFPIISKVALKKKDKLKIFGNNWDTKDGTGVRDYIHVMDLAEGHILALKYLNNVKEEFLNINLGNGIGTSVLELIKTYQESNNVEIPFEFVGRRKGDFGHVVADNSKAISLLKWKPKRSIKDMCKDSWRWYLLYPNGYV